MREWTRKRWICIIYIWYCVQWKMNRELQNLHINQRCEINQSIPMKKEHAADKLRLAGWLASWWSVVKTVVSILLFWSSVDQRCSAGMTTAQQQQQQPCRFGVNLFKSSVTLFIVVWPGHIPICWYNKKNKSNNHAIFRAIYDIRTSNKTVSIVSRDR